MSETVKLTKVQAEQLRFMAVTDVTDITDESVVKALARKGLAERYVERMGHLSQRHCWRIAPVGRAALEASR